MSSRINLRLIYLHGFKLGHNAVEETRNINTAWGEGSAAEFTKRRWFVKFRRGDLGLEVGESWTESFRR